MTWQPIETAPKNIPILLWDSVQQMCVVANNHYNTWFVNDTYGFCEDGEIPSHYVTH